MALVGWQYGCVVSDLLAPVSGKDVEFIVENSDFAVWVTRTDSDLEIRGEEIGNGCDIESVDGCILENETGFFGLENSPYDEEHEEEDEEDDENGAEYTLENFLPFVFVVATLFC